METAKYPIHPTIRRTHPRLLCLSAYIVLLSQYFRLRYMRYKLMARAYRNTKKESKHANENLANENQFRYMYIIPGENIWPPRAASRGIVFCHLFICRVLVWAKQRAVQWQKTTTFVDQLDNPGESTHYNGKKNKISNARQEDLYMFVVLARTKFECFITSFLFQCIFVLRLVSHSNMEIKKTMYRYKN